ncbi:MAG: hypothetical protein P1U63_11465 [Coxiellaceae bacterium]|nr:hypothetical protein [Coxiellaceae bacterium]
MRTAAWLTVSAILPKLISAICFEQPTDDGIGHDTSLDCNDIGYKATEAGIFSELKKQCKVYQDQDSNTDCAHFFTGTKNYGSGWYGEPACSVSYHDTVAPLDPCVDRVVKEMAPQHALTMESLIVTAGLAVVGVVLIALCYCLHKDRKDKARVVENDDLKEVLVVDTDGEDPQPMSKSPAKH